MPDNVHVLHVALGRAKVSAPSGWTVRCMCGWSKKRRYRSAAEAELRKHIEQEGGR